MPPSDHATCAPATSAVPNDAGLKSSYEALESQSQLLRQNFVVQNQEGKSTGGTYERHYKNYTAWFEEREARLVQQDPSYQPIPALPITAAKVTLFLDYEMTRPQKRKRTDGTESTSTCGREHGRQVVSALEHYRFDSQHLHRHIPEAQVTLRSDSRIKTLEAAFAHNEPERTKKAHALKAAGTRADTYTDTQLSKLAMSGLDSKGPTTIWRAMRDRAMLLTSSSTAFRGDSSRSLLWSDMYCCDVPMHAKGQGEKLRALTLIADNSKQNQSGRVDEHGAFRHLCVELCPVGAIGFLFFAHFHIINSPVPNFSVDFTDPDYGDYGRREWYELFTFSTTKDCKKEMCYATHRDRVKGLYQKNDITISKVTHAGRGFTAKTARENGASSIEVKALGGWSDSGSYRACYDRALPVRGLLAAAMFDSENPGAHFLARDSLEPPAEIIAQIFPWVEEELSALTTRESENRQAHDIALRHFLELLLWLRMVIVQDGAVLYTQNPDASIFKFPPFNSTVFRQFASNSTAVIAKAEKDVALALEKLPQNIVHTFNAAMIRLSIDQQLERVSSKAFEDEMKAQIAVLQGLVEEVAVGNTRKRRKTGHAVLPPPQIPPPPIPIPRDIVYPTLAPTATPDIPQTFSSSYLAFEDGFDFTGHGLSLASAPQNPQPFSLEEDFYPQSFSFNEDFDFSSLSLPPLPITPPAAPQFEPEQLAALEYIRGSQSPATEPPTKPLTHATAPSIPIPHSTLASRPVVAPALPIPPPIRLPASAPPPVGASLTPSETQTAAWQRMAEKYSDSRLRRHQWEWITSGPKANTYMPYYQYQPLSKVTDIWTEYTDGLNGHLSTRDLDEGWSRPSWRRKVHTLKTEACRRKKVVDLINKLREKRNWTVDLALRFVEECHETGHDEDGKPLRSTVRLFMDYVGKRAATGKTSNFDKLLLQSNSYTR
ncbi:hypothetical protein MVEN_00307500 [Mycena venus]|uniref:Ndc10 domain-containing protein n=1 Tax=Mycena venus TaxID=2733690 RepID=A0A8H6Z310_9AGAR|nr:hypothetical protein MVEN_00307500 [Mycena venus]